MGCGGSAPFPDNEDAFFKPEDKREKESRYLDEANVSEDKVMKLCLKKDMFEKPADYTVKKEDGTDIYKIVTNDRIIKITDMAGEMKALMIHDVRFTEVNGVDSAFNLPHLYIYSSRPYVEGTKESDFVDEGNPVHFWARVHKTGMGKNEKKFELGMAEGKKGMENLNLEMFHAAAFESKLFPDDRMTFHTATSKKGACLVNEAKFSFECAGCYSVSVGPCVDPVLMLCAVMGVESLKER